MYVANCSQCMSGMIWGLYHLQLADLVLPSINCSPRFEAAVAITTESISTRALHRTVEKIQQTIRAS